MENIAKLIRDRRSVRTFDGVPLTDTHLEKIRDFMADIASPWSIPVEFRLLDADTYGLVSPVISGTKLYVGAKVRRVTHAEEAFGYSMEMLVLFAQSLGIGMVWLDGLLVPIRSHLKPDVWTGTHLKMVCASSPHSSEYVLINWRASALLSR